MLTLAASQLSAALPNDTAAQEIAAKRLIVQFKHGKDDPYWPDAIARATLTPAADALLYGRLGRPEQAVRLLEGITPPKLREELRQRPDSLRGSLERYMVLVFPDSASAKVAKVRLHDDPGVESVSFDLALYFASVPNDPFFSAGSQSAPPGEYQWGMQLLNLPAAWEKQRGHAYLAAADSGVYHDCTGGTCIPHPDLRQNFRAQFSGNFNNLGLVSADVHDTLGHGTHVAGIMSATPNNNAGVAGACWNCAFAALRVGASSSVISGLSRALTHASDHGVQGLNLSIVDDVNVTQSCLYNDEYLALCVALARAKERGLAVAASAGNNRKSHVGFPALVPGVIAVGGLQYNSAGPTYWQVGYGNGNTCPADGYGPECGSNYGARLDVMAPALDVMSTVKPGAPYNQNLHCGDAYPNGTPNADGYGDCTGTSMSAPHITGLVGLIRSSNPLLNPDQVLAALKTGGRPCVGDYSERCGDGQPNGARAPVPDARRAVEAALGSRRALNRLTPLFSFYSNPYRDAGNVDHEVYDHFYTTVPQMALAALTYGGLLPQPAIVQDIAYHAIGSPVTGYNALPEPECSFSPCLTYGTPKAIASIFTTHVSPVGGGPELVPLHRYSWACSNPNGTGCPGGNAYHVSHVYSTDTGENFPSQGYQLDGIEGYLYPRTQARPAGTVKLCRKYDSTRDDYVLFPAGGDGTDCSATTDGYTGGNYGPLPGGLPDWLGWVYPVTIPHAVCSAGAACGRDGAFVPILLYLLDE